MSWYLMYRGQSVNSGTRTLASQWVSDSLSLSEPPTGQSVPKNPYKSLLRGLCSPLSFGSLPSFFSQCGSSTSPPLIRETKGVKHGEILILPCVCILMIGKHDYCNPIDCQANYSERKPRSLKIDIDIASLDNEVYKMDKLKFQRLYYSGNMLFQHLTILLRDQ